GGLPGPPAAADQLALPAADRHHRVDRLEPGLQRLFHALPIHDARRETLDRRELRRRNRTLAVDRLSERVDDTAEHLVTDGHRDDAARAFHEVPFLDLLVLAEQHRAHAFLFEVERDSENAVRELQHLAGHRVVDAVHAGDAVADGDDAADFGDVDVDRVTPDLFADDLGYLVGFYFHDVDPVVIIDAVGADLCVGPEAGLSSRGGHAGPPLRRTTCQTLLHLLQLPCHAAVVHRVA